MIEELYFIYLKHPEIVTDTRKIKPNSLFFALRGPNFDANTLAEQALNLGSSYAVIDNPEFKKSDRYILVDDVLSTLQQLANHHRKQLKIPILGLTGSNGKTTTKELIHAVLQQKFKTHATAGNLNNHIGVPLTLLGIKKEHEFAIIEMGANHVGEIKFLSELAEPDFGMITNIGIAHIEGFGSAEAIKKAKSELYDFIYSKKGTLFVNGDDETLMNLSANHQRIIYGDKSEFNTRGKYISADPFVKIETENQIIQSNLAGKYNYNNILAAVCIGKHFGISIEKIKKGIEDYIPENNRSQIIKKNSNTIIMDAYNANPSSMKAAIENFEEMNAPTKIAFLGDMFEMGHVAKEEHQKIIDQINTKKLKAIFFGKEFSTLLKNQSQHLFFETAEQSKSYFENNKIENTLILIKGSRGMKLESILEWI